MAAHKDSSAAPALDEDGLQIQSYVSMVLVVVPPEGYGEQALRFCRSSLYNVRVGTRTVSSEAEELIRGRLQDEFQVDGPLQGESMQGYSGVIFVGGESASDFLDDPEVHRLAREARAADKMIGTWGEGTAILARAGVLNGLKVTGSPTLAAEIRRAGGRYTGRQVEVSGTVVTGLDEAVGMRLGKELARIVGI
jgi:putative intracellular protease/amidase